MMLIGAYDPTEPIEEEELLQLERLSNLGTPGPWLAEMGAELTYEQMVASLLPILTESRGTRLYYTGTGLFGTSCTFNGPTSKENAALIAESRNALPRLIAEVRRLRKAVSERQGLPSNYVARVQHMLRTKAWGQPKPVPTTPSKRPGWDGTPDGYQEKGVLVGSRKKEDE